MHKTLLLLILAIGFLACGGETSSETPAESAEWRPLFNGKDLTGWTPKFSGYELGVNHLNTFRVEDGMIRAVYAEYDSFHNAFGHLFYEEPFSDYHLRWEYRITGEGTPGAPVWAYKNSGIMYHSQSSESMGVDQDFPVSLEFQFLAGDPGDTTARATGNLCTPGTHVVWPDTLTEQHILPSAAPTFRDTSWIPCELIVHHDSLIVHIVAGDTVLQYRNPVLGGQFLPDDYPLPAGTPLREGYLALQAEGHPVDFRKIEIRELPQ
jgi:hypothetical protein